jgi:hypothetical protein
MRTNNTKHRRTSQLFLSQLAGMRAMNSASSASISGPLSAIVPAIARRRFCSAAFQG